MRDLRHYFPGTLLILVAFLILMVPEILVAFVAAFLLVAGLGALYIGHTIRRSEMEYVNLERWVLAGRDSGQSSVRSPRFVRWYRKI